MIDHDRLFKELLTTFFTEFLELFLPDVAAFIEPNTLEAMDKEIFTDVTAGEKHIVDILMKAQFKGKEKYFLLHVELQSSADSEFNVRMSRYFARLDEKYDKDVYPIVLLSYDKPRKKAKSSRKMVFPNKKRVLDFQYDVIQLNRLEWNDFLNHPNPIASALMAKMHIAPADRVKVKLACLKMLAGLKLNAAEEQLISGFVDIYLRLGESEKEQFDQQVAEIKEPETKEKVMQITTSWKEEGILEGIEKGIEKGRQEGKIESAIILTTSRFGELPKEVTDLLNQLPEEKIDTYLKAIFTFNSLEDVANWLKQ